MGFGAGLQVEMGDPPLEKSADCEIGSRYFQKVDEGSPGTWMPLWEAGTYVTEPHSQGN